MKPAFKTTAVAILVALGVTACKSNDSSNPAPQPTPVNNQANTGNTQANNATQDTEQARLEAEKKAQEAEQARLDAEKKAKEAADLKAKEEAEKARLEAEKKAQEAEQARLEAEKKAKEAADLKAKEEAEKARLEAEKKAKEAEQARLDAEKKAKEAADLKAKEEAEKARLEAEKKAKEAEKARLEAEKKAKEAEQARLAAEQKANEAANRVIKLNTVTVDREDDIRGNLSGRRLEFFGKDPSVKDLAGDNISYGYIEGTKSYDQNIGVIVDKVKQDDKRYYETTKFTKDMNYSLVHQPYATYGMLYLDTHRIHDFIIPADSFEYYQLGTVDNQGNVVYGEEKDAPIIGYFDSNTRQYHFADHVKGSATYKGDVVAYTRTNQNGGFYHTKPVHDGDVILTATFAPSKDNSKISGVINSKTLGGQIILNPSDLSLYRDSSLRKDILKPYGDSVGTATIGDTQYGGKYTYQMSGHNLEYITGRVELVPLSNGSRVEPIQIAGALKDNPKAVPENLPLYYKAVFGAEKQSK